MAGCLTGESMALADSIWGAVRQEGPSPLVHASAFGSNVHFVGFSSTPSLTPSRASHACSTALWIIGYFDAGMALCGVRFMYWFTARRAACIRIEFHADAPATMPSKSSG